MAGVGGDVCHDRLRRDQTAEREWVPSVADATGALRQVVDDLAVGTLPARARTRVLAPVPDAGSVGRAVRVERALWPAALVGVADVLGQAGAGARSVLLPTDGVHATRRGLTGVEIFLRGDHLDGVALHEGVSSVASDTDAASRVADHSALGVLTAGSRARVAALLVDAGQVLGALAVGHALGSAVGRCADKADQARAGRLVTSNPALGVGTAGRRLARLGWDGKWLVF